MVQPQDGGTRPEPVITPGWKEAYVELHVPAATRHGRLLFLSGHTGIRPDGTYPSDPEGQFRLAFGDLEATLASQGATWGNVVQATSYHVRMREHMAAFEAVHHERVPEPYPAWTAVGVAELYTEEALIEISAIAVLSDEGRS